MAVRHQSLRLGVAPSPYTPLSGETPCRICLARLPTGLEALARPGPSPPRPPIALSGLHRKRIARGTGILTRCPSPTALALGLGPPHPQLISMAAEPWGIRWGGFAPPSRYSCRHSHSHALQICLRASFTAAWDAPLPRASKRTSAASVFGLSPGGLSAPRHLRPVSYYALFQGWLLLSQPPGC